MTLLGILLSVLLNTQAECSPLSLRPVGDDGGYRLGGDCQLSGEKDICPIDTGAAISVVALNERNKDYPSLGEKQIHSIGLVINCNLVKIPDFKLFERKSPETIFHRCENLPSVKSLIGLDFFFHHTFTLNFTDETITIDAHYPKKKEQLYGFASNKLLISGELDGETVRIAFDTGAPVTLVDQNFVDQHPQIFVESGKPPTEMMKRRGLRRFEMHSPLFVHGIPLYAEFVYAADVQNFSTHQYVMLLGVNHMKHANWHFDLQERTWAIFP